MRSLLRNLSVGSRLAAAFGLLCLLLLVVAGAGEFSVDRQASAREEQAQVAAVRSDVTELTHLAAEVVGWQATVFAQASVNGPAQATDPEAPAMAGLLRTMADAEALLAEVDVDTLAAEGRAPHAQVEADWVDLLDAVAVWNSELTVATTPTALGAALAQISEGRVASAFAALDASGQALSDALENQARAVDADADGSANLGRMVIAAATLAALAATVAMAVTVTHSIVAPIRRVVVALEQVADGDLTATADVDQKDEIGQLAASFQATTTSVREIIRTIASSSVTLAATAHQIAEASNFVQSSAAGTAAEATEGGELAVEVSRNVATLAAGSEQMGASIQEIARGAQEAADIAASAVHSADATAVSVERLGASSQEIGEVVKVISSIAAQTNLLALNATIEAARAGEAGKGFAVVASEVKELAQETARATEEITRRVATIQSDANGAATAIEEIGSIVGRISDSQTSIAAAVEEQTLTTREMSRNVADAASGATDIAGIVTKVASDASGAAEVLRNNHSSVDELTQMAAELETLMGSFRHE